MSLLKRLLLPHPHNNHRAKVRHTSGLAWLSLLSLLVPLWINTISTTSPQVLGYASVIPATRLIELTNSERTKQGLNTLTVDPQLNAAASAKAQDMLAKNYWAHVSPSGSQPWVFFTNAGYTYMYAGENLARDFSDPDSVVAAWMASPTHRDNILNAQFQDIGIAVVDGTLDGVETTLVVQHFGRKRTPAPAVQSANTIAQPTKVPVPTSTPVFEEIVDDQEVLYETEDDPEASTAAILEPQPPVAQKSVTVPSTFTPLQFAKSWNIAIVGILVFVLSAESLVIWWRRIPRISGRPLAHLLFMLMLMATLLYSQSGLIK